MSAMISIDFGNSFTKVGIRPLFEFCGPGCAEIPRCRESRSELAKDRSLDQDDGLNICVPSLVASVSQSGRKAWYYGTDVLRLSKTPGTKVFRNWKSTFFQNVEQSLKSKTPVPVGAPSGSGPVRRVAETGVREIASNLGIPFEVYKDFLREQGIEIAPAGPEVDDMSKEFLEDVATGFFTWLRTFIDPICRKRGLPDVSTIPVRISLPSFGSQTKAEHLLVDVLQKSGWKSDDRFPALPEPLSNSIGVFTEGHNSTWQPPKRRGQNYPHNARMFGKSEMFKALRNRILQGGEQFYWTMVVDIGGYTADFAMLGFDLDESFVQLEGKCDGMSRMATFSEPIGVRTLDTRIRDVLKGGKQEYLRESNEDPDQRRIETFHRKVYDGLRPYDTGKYGIIGEGAEREDIRRCIVQFAEEIAEYAQEFLVIEQYKQIDSLILTGGGCSIPLVRSTLCDRLAKYRKNPNYAATYLPSGSSENLPAKSFRLDPYLARGATALGGASVFFDFAPLPE